jgi:hypothetical protein
MCRVAITLEAAALPFGPAGDVLFVPMRVTGGTVTGLGPARTVAYGTDFGSMFADEQFVHNGNLMVGDPAGNVLLWFDGTSQGEEGAYDGVIEGTLPGPLPSRFAVRVVSTNPLWKTLNKKPLQGIGSFDGASGTLAFALLAGMDGEPPVIL